ncbi:TetR/AcrR family transcriptional regulator [Pleomorphomonas sp. JP5]|uniref:TetR/AcrR family transcriptional regulator n=1 Tax=Pleomorphomonas sp. JP5 TaxID=2942998 RepID=UPI0020447569|nr:TetR/AcrR family transcriptional regulator [Pleomorphomonas sp. JP5]MCM5559196.1 TetR/AcrR family transcriptional regulator [Pleomorphomonas sp. JP5]
MDSRREARERLRKLPDAQRTAWLNIAEEEFMAFGFEAASLNRILTRAAISKGQAYYYFADKGELYRAVIERAFSEFAGLLEVAPAAPDSAAAYWQQIAALFGNVTTILQQNERLAEIGRGVYREARAQIAIVDLLENLHSRFERLIETGQRLGAVRSDLPLDLLTSMAFAALREADRWFALNARGYDQGTVLMLNRRVFNLFTAILAPSGESHLAGPSATSF